MTGSEAGQTSRRIVAPLLRFFLRLFRTRDSDFRSGFARGVVFTLLCGIVGLSGGGCTLAVQDGKPSSTPISFGGPSQSCMDRSLPALQGFFAGTALEDDVDEVWTCMQGALDLFQKHVHGADSSIYTARELRTFIQKYFLREHQISDALLMEIMRLKQAVVGGSIEVITREELKQVDSVLEVLRGESVRILPYMRFLTLRLEPEDLRDKKAFIEDGLEQLARSSRVLGAMLANSRSSYHLSDAERLLREIGKLYEGFNGWDGPGKLMEQMPTVAALKAFFLRPNGHAIAPAEWPELVLGAGRLYSLFLRYRYLVGDQPLLSGQGLSETVRLAEDVFSLLEGAVKVKEGQVIAYQEIDALIDRFYALKFIEIPLTPPTAKQMVRVGLEKICNPAVRSRRAKVEGLTLRALETLKKDTLGWAEMQGLWDRMAPSKATVTVKEIRETLKATKLEHADAGAELEHLFGRRYPLAFNADGTVVLKRAQASALTYDRGAWANINLRRLMIRLAARGYSGNFTGNSFEGLRKSQWKQLFDDMRDAASELKFLDPRDEKLWSNTFDEANIFLFSSDGNDRLSFAEGTELLSFILSGAKVTSRVYQDLRNNCRNLDPDHYGNPKIDVPCYRRRIRAQFGYYYANVPSWVAAAGRFGGQQWTEFQKTIEMASRKNGYTDAPVESDELNKTSVLLQYIETLFLRFDRDNSGTFTLAESKLAYPLLRGILRDLSGLTDEHDLLSLYTYLLKYGVSPEEDLWTGFRFIWWKSNPDQWILDADRAQIMKVLANLSAARDK